jgi:hypothetical protein
MYLRKQRLKCLHATVLRMVVYHVNLCLKSFQGALKAAETLFKIVPHVIVYDDDGQFHGEGFRFQVSRFRILSFIYSESVF